MVKYNRVDAHCTKLIALHTLFSRSELNQDRMALNCLTGLLKPSQAQLTRHFKTAEWSHFGAWLVLRNCTVAPPGTYLAFLIWPKETYTCKFLVLKAPQATQAKKATKVNTVEPH